MAEHAAACHLDAVFDKGNAAQQGSARMVVDAPTKRQACLLLSLIAVHHMCVACIARQQGRADTVFVAFAEPQDSAFAAEA